MHHRKGKPVQILASAILGYPLTLRRDEISRRSVLDVVESPSVDTEAAERRLAHSFTIARSLCAVSVRGLRRAQASTANSSIATNEGQRRSSRQR
jgi:hypothetical protein